MAQTLFDKIWDKHVVAAAAGFPDTLYIDKHFINKTTSARAFEGLKRRNLWVSKPGQTFVMAEPEYRAHLPESAEERFQTDLFHKNCADFELNVPGRDQYCHDDCVWGLPGQVVLADQDNVDNIGALGVLAIAISETQVEQVLATQCLLMSKPLRTKVELTGNLSSGISAKDIAYHIIANVSPSVTEGHFIEFCGDTITRLDIVSRMQICNSSREIGAIGGIIAPDELSMEYLRSSGINLGNLLTDTLTGDEDAVFDQTFSFRAEDIVPGNYMIDLSILLNSSSGKDASLLAFEQAGILEGYNDIEYILKLKDEINRFENKRTGRNGD